MSSGYRGGHILRIKVKNFMTYDELELFPKHGLNLIIGLNGSGKSSIMCAICLALAGKPTFTGRSVQLSDFIKYGCDKATIEIELEKISKRNVVITRILHNDKSTWLLNKTPASLNEIQNAVKKFNIDVSNLCQFLPQEKVTEFSKMNKKQRLENMLQAIGEPQLVTLFKELKDLKMSSLKIEDEKRTYQNVKEEEDKANKRLKVDVDKYEEKLRLKHNIKTLSQYKMILEYNKLRAEMTSLSEKSKPLKTQLAKVNLELEQLTKDKDTKTSEIKQILVDIKNTVKSSVKSQEQITSKEEQLSSLNEKIRKGKILYENKLKEKRDQEKRLFEMLQQINCLKQVCKEHFAQKSELEDRDKQISQNLEDIQKDMVSLTSDLAYAKLERNKLDYSIRDIKIQIEKRQSIENKKMDILKQKYKDVYDAVIWLKENGNRFRATVHFPMLLSLKVHADDNRKYIENVVALRDFIAFLCEDKEDNKLLTNILRIEKKLNVNIVMVPDNPLEYYASPNLQNNLRKLGVQCFLKDIIEVPDAVMCFLCHCYKLHKIPLCLQSAEKNMNDILRNFTTFFTPEARISGKQSKYGARNVCIRRDIVKSRNLLPSSSVQCEEYEDLMERYQAEEKQLAIVLEKWRKLEEKIKELEKEESTLRNEKKAIIEKINTFRNSVTQLEQKKIYYNKKASEVIDEENEKFVMTTLIQGVNGQKIEICKSLKDDLKKYMLLKKRGLEQNLKARYIIEGADAEKKQFIQKTNEKENLETQIAEISIQRKEAVSRGMGLKSEIEKFYNTEQDKKLFEPYKAHTLETIEKERCNLQAKLDLNCEDNEAVLEEYNERKKKIAKTLKQIENYDEKLRQLQNEMNEKKSEWLPSLQTHIRNINAKFSQYYKQLKCAGEISLDTCNNSDDFPNYGLQITLKYRDNEPFQELSNTRHSGGECSVAAIIFILSLQELTEVPFRCIDEINQGMDSQNERNIYHLIAENAKSGSCSQYFLLTPKLLMDLEMIEHRDVAVHIIYNSCFLDMKMDVMKHIDLAGRN